MSNFKLEIGKDNIANLIFDLKNEKVNILRSDILLELEKELDLLKNNKKIKLLIFKSAKEGNFIAGADINEIKDLTDEKEAINKVKKGQDILNKIANLPFTTLCYINGSAMGGGTELALACDFRVAAESEKSLIALPEVKLGIFPGFGGTQRLPRLIGIIAALPLILTGKAIVAKKAYKIGLIDGYFPIKYEKTHLDKFIKKILDEKQKLKILKRRKPKFLFLQKKILRDFIFNKAKKNILKQTSGHYPAPLAAIDVMRRTIDLPIEKGLEIEHKEFAKLVIGDVCKNLIDIYFTTEEIKRNTGSKANFKLKIFKNTAVLGAGVMGGGIAWLYSKLDMSVRIKDINNNSLALAYSHINKIYNELLKIRKYSRNQVINKLSLISLTTVNEGFKNCDLMSEAVTEDIKLKKKLLADFEPYLNKKTIIASNTSSLSITEMAKSLKNPERFIGMHYFNPVNRMPLIEVIPGKETSEETLVNIVSLCKKLGKTPVIVADVPGFLVNRILLTYINEAFHILSETAMVRDIDEIACEFGMPMGPLHLADVVGLDVGYKVAKILEKSYGSRMQVSKLIETIYNDLNLVGKKNNEGIYLYKNEHKFTNDKVISLCKKQKISDADILDRLLLIMVNEAARSIDEKVVSAPNMLDIAMIMGTGFPPFRGGILKYADSVGLEKILERLKYLARKYGKRFEPAPYIVKLVKNKQNFYN